MQNLMRFFTYLMCKTHNFVFIHVMSVYPSGYQKLYENYVSVYAGLLSSRQHCHVSTIQLSILTPKNIQKNEESFYYYILAKV